MMRRPIFFTLTALLLALAATVTLLLALDGGQTPVAHAQGPDGYDTYYVAPGGNCGGMTPCYASVQAAVDAADDPDGVVKVAAGTYTDVNSYGGLAQMVYISKTVTVRGGYTTTDWDTSDPEINPTTLDAQRQGRVIYITGEISPTIEGLSITGGDAHGLEGHWWSSGDAGGGVYIITATAVIKGNHIFSNTAQGGGGLYLFQSTATVSENSLSDNKAIETHGWTGGGGLYLYDSPATINNNTIISNTTAYNGGGLHLYGSNAALIGNIVNSNAASNSGGGLYTRGSSPVFNGNTVSVNTANAGGGLFLSFSNTIFNDNTIISNTAGSAGGGLYLYHSDPTIANTVIANNRGNVGSGLFVEGSRPHLMHTTIARNHGGNGSGIDVNTDWYWGGEPRERMYSTLMLTNTILVSHTVGIDVEPNSTATLEATLWGNGAWTNDSDWGGAGSIITGTVNIWGDPAFMNPDARDYHICSGSAARDAGVYAGVTTDIDGDSRPTGAGYDIGADEFLPNSNLMVTKQAVSELVQGGEQLTYTITITNTGNVDLHATATDTLPSQVTPTGELVWSPTITAPDGVWMQQIVVTVTEGYSGTLTNVVQASTLEGASGIYTITSQAQSPEPEPKYPVYLPLVLRDD